MGLRSLNEERRHARRPLMGDLTGSLLVASGRRPVPCLAVDLSNAGLRILAREELSPGVSMFLSIEGYNLPLVVVWCQPDTQSEGSYACGLASASDADLESFFRLVGWLDEGDIIDGLKTENWVRSLELVSAAAEETDD